MMRCESDGYGSMIVVQVCNHVETVQVTFMYSIERPSSCFTEGWACIESISSWV